MNPILAGAVDMEQERMELDVYQWFKEQEIKYNFSSAKSNVNPKLQSAGKNAN